MLTHSLTPTSPTQLALSVVLLALGIHLTALYETNYYAKHSMATAARYGAWSGGFGIFIAGIGMVLTLANRAQAILMICLDVLAAVFFLVCGCVSWISFLAATSPPWTRSDLGW